MSLKAGKEALLRKRYTEAIALLTEYCQGHPDPDGKDYIQAQMWLVSAYRSSGRADKAIDICEALQAKPDPQLQQWAKQSLIDLRQQLDASPRGKNAYAPNDEVASVVRSRPNRYRKPNVTLAIAPKATWLYRLAATGTVLFELAVIFSIIFWVTCQINTTLIITPGWLLISSVLTAIVGVVLFFMSPWIIDVCQKQFQKVQWITLAELDEKSPEAVEVIERFCQSRNIDIPRLGWIEDDNPAAYAYGVIRNSSRLVVSRGLIRNLENDEIAAVYAYQLGQITNGSSAIATFADAPLQLIYLFHVWLSRLSFRAKRGKGAFRFLAEAVRLVHHWGSYPLFFVSRTSAVLSDHYAAAATGNPNATSRALAKVARGIVTQNQMGQISSRLLESTRNIGFCDYHTAIPTGMAFEVLYSGQSDQDLYRVFLWELFNPWGIWSELHSSHPLIGRRIATMTAYTKQLGLTCEYDFDLLLRDGKTLNRAKLYQNFAFDVAIETAPLTGAAIGLGVAAILYWLYNNWLPLSLGAVGLGVGFMLQGSLRYPDYRNVLSTDLVSLLIDPYASSLRGRPVQIPGELVSYTSTKNQLGYGLKLEDQSGLIYLEYMPDLKTQFGDPAVTVQRLESLVGESVVATGWFRRGEMPVVDLANLEALLAKRTAAKPLPGYHQLWNNFISSALILSGLGLMAATSLF